MARRPCPFPERRAYRHVAASIALACVTFRLRHDAQPRPGGVPAVGVLLLGLLVGHRAGDDHVLALLPLGRRRHGLVRGQLQRVDHAQHLVEVAAGGHGVDQHQLDLLVRADHEHVAQRRVLRGRALGGVALNVLGEHAVQLRDVEVAVRDDRVVGRGALGLGDVLGPLLVVLQRVDRQADDLHAAAVEVRLDAGHVAQLGGADGGEVARVAEQHGPAVADPVVEVDPALGGVGLEVRCVVADGQRHGCLPVVRGHHLIYSKATGIDCFGGIARCFSRP